MRSLTFVLVLWNVGRMDTYKPVAWKIGIQSEMEIAVL